jgi:hypothetical protein
MKISCEFKDWASVVQFVRSIPNLEGAGSPLTVTIKRIFPGGFYAVDVTEDSSSTSPLSGSEPQPTTLSRRPCNGQREHDYGPDGTCNYCGDERVERTSKTPHSRGFLSHSAPKDLTDDEKQWEIRGGDGY